MNESTTNPKLHTARSRIVDLFWSTGKAIAIGYLGGIEFDDSPAEYLATAKRSAATGIGLRGPDGCGGTAHSDLSELGGASGGAPSNRA
jgi:hypothetical protein